MSSQHIDRIGVSKIARALNISPPAVSKWKVRGVPATRVRDVVRVADGAVTAHDLRPDLFPPGFEFPPDTTTQPRERAA